MPETTRIVTNTGPILALIAATGDLEILKMRRAGIWLSERVVAAACEMDKASR